MPWMFCVSSYTTVDIGGSHCDSLSVLDGLERLYWWQSKHCDDWVSFSTETDIGVLFTAATDKRCLTSYKLEISIIIIIIIIN